MHTHRNRIPVALRWRIAAALNRLPGQCWADLVMWALNYAPDQYPWWRPWRPAQPTCRTAHGCYCGTFPPRCDTAAAVLRGEK